MQLAPGPQERKVLDAYISDRRRRGGTELSLIQSIPGLRNKLAYMYALLFPDRDFLAARATRGSRPSRINRWMIPIRWVIGRQR